MTHLSRMLLSIVAPTAAVAATVLAGPATAAPGSVAPLPQTTFEVDELTHFTSPSGNISCVIDSSQVRCDIAERDWAPPARSANCPDVVDWGQGLQLSAGEPADIVCAGDTTFGAGEPLDYGDKIVAGALECTSLESGMQCWDLQYGGEFTLAREGYEVR